MADLLIHTTQISNISTGNNKIQLPKDDITRGKTNAPDKNPNHKSNK